MKAFHWLALLAATQFAGLSAAAGLSSQELVAVLPQCAVDCLTNGLAKSSCSPTDEQCLCSNATLSATIGQCIQSACTIKEALTATNATSVACNAPIRDHGSLYNTILIVFVTISAVSVSLRLFSRYISDAGFGIDDLTITLTLAFTVAYTIVMIYGLTANGMGRDFWAVPFYMINNFFQFFIVAELLYFTQLPLIKISILFFFLRIFPGATIKKFIYGTIGVNVFLLVIFDILVLVQCRPLSYFWHQWDGEHHGTCFDSNALAWANAGVSIALDIWLLVLPLTQVLTLNLHWKRKVAVAMMFSVGAFVAIVSIVRLKYLAILFNSGNPTWDYFSAGTWTNVEINVAIICACMPNMRVLLVRAFPKMASSNHESKNTYLRDTEGNRINASKLDSKKGGISFSKSYDVRYSRKQPQGGNSQVELVDVHRETF